MNSQYPGSPRSFPINSFKQTIQTKYGLSRGYLFELSIIHEKMIGPNGDKTIQYQCRSAQLPSYTIETSQISCMGMTGNIPGKRTYEPITLTFYQVNADSVRKKFLQWQQDLRSFDANVRTPANPTDATILLMQYDETGLSPATYKLNHAFPTSVSGLNFSNDNDAEFQTFDVTFAYLFMEYQENPAYKDGRDLQSIAQQEREQANSPLNLPAGAVPGVQTNFTPPSFDGAFNPDVFRRINFGS